METPFELLFKYCRNQISAEENQQLEQWLSDKDNFLLFQKLKKEWHYIDDDSDVIPDKQMIWKEIQARIAQQKHKTKRIKWYRMVAAASVAAIIAFISSILYFYPSAEKQSTMAQHIITSTKTNEKRKVILADGTQVWLNSNSTLSYNNDYNANSREVTASGEFFFDVTPSNKKFIINTGKVKIEVLGTAFNLKAFTNENVEISLKRGKIAVLNSQNNKQLFVMNFSRHATVNQNDLSYVLETKNTNISDVWTEKKLTIYNEPLSSIIEKLEAWYGIEISYDGLDINKRYSFDLEDETPQEFLELFSAIASVRYTVNGKKIHIQAIEPQE